MKTREQITPAVEWREESTRCRTVHWSFRASGWPKSSKLIGFQSCPFTSNWKTFLVIRQINHTSLMHPLSIHLPHPSSLPFLSSHSPPPFISSFTVFFRLSATDQEGKGREGGRHSRRNLRDRSNRLSHASADQGWPSRLPPSSGDFPLEFTSVFTDRQMRAMKPGTREDGAKIHLTRQDESHPFVAWNDQIGETLTRPFARWPVTRAGRRGIGCRDSMIGGGRGYFRYWIFVGLIIDVAVAKSWILFDLRRRNRG